MDYKVIIILIALLFLIILIYKEVNELKDQWNKNMADMSIYLNQHNEKMLLKVQGNMNKYIAQIKGIGSDNLQQLGKITLLNHQPIIDRKTPNHFTETDISNYMSDKVGAIEEENNKIFEKKENSHYYMSEDTRKHNDSDKKIEQKAKTESEKKIEQKAKTESEKKIEQKAKTESEKKKNNVICDNNKCSIINVDNEPNDIPLYVPVENIETIPIYQKISTPVQMNKSTNTLETSMIEEDDYEFSDEHNSFKKNTEIEIDLYDVINGADIKNIIGKNDDTMYVDLDNNDEKGSSDSINIEKDITHIDLTKSVQEMLSEHSQNGGQLKNIDEYDAQELREIAKKFGIPTTYREKNKSKQYKKQDLYSNILSHLNNKS